MPSQTQDDELVMGLVEMVLASPPHDFDRRLQEACAGDTELMEQVRTYVTWEMRMDGFLSEPLYPRRFFEHPFEPGQLLEQRFRIIREVAQGGMGIVYEALDEKLERRIALKCAKVGYRKRLPPEVRNASEIGHPNICKIYEIHTATTQHGPLDFMTMEFLDGETLTERLRRGYLTHTEARPIALQLCSGLAEAHRKHVIHGDLKSSNIVLSAAAGSLRVVITDFGLARRPEASLQSVQSGETAGTPDYMAPELWNDAKASVATEVYAVGVILREMVCGQEPDARWNRVVNRCLSHEPSERYGSVDEVARALTPPSRRLLLSSAAATVLALMSGLLTYRTATAPSETVRLALLPLGSAADTLSRTVAAQMQRVQGSTTTELVVLPLSETVRHGVDTIDAARTALGATHVLHGSVVSRGEKLFVHAYLTDTRTQANRSEFKAEYAARESRYIPMALAGMVTGALRLPALTDDTEMNAAAQQHYLSGMLQMRKDSGADAAIDSMQKAVAADPHSPLTHSGQAEAWWWKYFVTKDRKYLTLAGSALKEAQRRNGDLAAVHATAGVLMLNNDMPEQAVTTLLRSIELEPGRADAHRRLATAYEAAAQADRAVAEYRQALKLDPDHHRNHQALGAYYYNRADYSEAVKHFKKAVELAPEESATHFALAAAYTDAGEFSGAESELRAALAIGETPVVLNNLGVTLMYQQRDQEAIPFLTRALQLWPERYLWWLNLGIAYRRLNLLTDSEEANRRGLVVAEAELKKNPRSGLLRGGIAYLWARLGDTRRAELEVAQALSIAPNDQGTRGMAVFTFEALERREDALKLLEGEPYGVLADISRFPDLASLAHDPTFLRLMDSKRPR